MRTVIHRNGQLAYGGEVYDVVHGGSRWGYAIYKHSGIVIAEGFDTLSDVRDYVDEYRRRGWMLGEDVRPIPKKGER